MNIVTLLNAGAVFREIAQIKTSPKIAYKIMKFCKAIEIEEEFYNSKRSEIVNMCAMKGDDGQPIVEDNMVRILPEKTAEANALMYELNCTEVEVPSVKFTLAELEGLEMSAADMYALDAFIEE